MWGIAMTAAPLRQFGGNYAGFNCGALCWDVDASFGPSAQEFCKICQNIQVIESLIDAINGKLCINT